MVAEICLSEPGFIVALDRISILLTRSLQRQSEIKNGWYELKRIKSLKKGRGVGILPF
jgi:hypothetical protein